MPRRRLAPAVLTGCLVALASAATLPAPLAAQACEPTLYGSVADVTYDTTTVHFDPAIEYGYTSATLTVTGPCEDVVKSFGPAQEITFDLSEIERIQDGEYRWELRFEPSISAETQQTLAAARGTGEEDAVWWSLWQEGEIPAGPSFDGGAFSVVAGAIIDPGSGSEEKGGTAGALARKPGGAAAAAAGFAAVPGERENSLATKSIWHNDDVIIHDSLCVGFSCSATGEAFGSDTIRLKENNVRLHFADTSASGYAHGDWRIVANSANAGGIDFLAFNDSDHGTYPFLVDGNAGHMAVRVAPGGKVGLGTGTPVTKLHLLDGDSPALRLEQVGSKGFAAQTWDVVGNDQALSVRDSTSGSQLPFRIEVGTPSNMLYTAKSARVGVGTGSPQATLHVQRSDGTTQVLVEDLGREPEPIDLVSLISYGPPNILLSDRDEGEEWTFGQGRIAGDRFVISRIGTGQAEVEILGNGDVIVAGSLTVGPGGCTGCDLVFSPEYPLESIRQHASYMWENRHLPGVGPTPEDQPMNLSVKTGGLLNELEKAHIYIDQLDQRLRAKDERLRELESELEAGRETVEELLARVARLEAERDADPPPSP